MSHGQVVHPGGCRTRDHFAGPCTSRPCGLFTGLCAPAGLFASRPCGSFTGSAMCVHGCCICSYCIVCVSDVCFIQARPTSPAPVPRALAASSPASVPSTLSRVHGPDVRQFFNSSIQSVEAKRLRDFRRGAARSIPRAYDRSHAACARAPAICCRTHSYSYCILS